MRGAKAVSSAGKAAMAGVTGATGVLRRGMNRIPIASTLRRDCATMGTYMVLASGWRFIGRETGNDALKLGADGWDFGDEEPEV